MTNPWEKYGTATPVTGGAVPPDSAVTQEPGPWDKYAPAQGPAMSPAPAPTTTPPARSTGEEVTHMLQSAPRVAGAAGRYAATQAGNAAIGVATSVMGGPAGGGPNPVTPFLSSGAQPEYIGAGGEVKPAPPQMGEAAGEFVRGQLGKIGFPWSKTSIPVLDSAVQAASAALVMGGPRGAPLRTTAGAAGGAATDIAGRETGSPAIQAVAGLLAPLVVGGITAGIMRPSLAGRTFQQMAARAGLTAADVNAARDAVLASVPRDASGRPSGPPTLTLARALVQINPRATEFVAMENEIRRAPGGAQVMAQWQNRIAQGLPEAAARRIETISPGRMPTTNVTAQMQQTAQQTLGDARRSVNAAVQPLFDQARNTPIMSGRVASVWDQIMGLAEGTAPAAMKTKFAQMAYDLVDRWEVRKTDAQGTVTWEPTIRKPQLQSVLDGEARPQVFHHTIGPLDDWIRHWNDVLNPENPALGLDPTEAAALKTAAGRTGEIRSQFRQYLMTQDPAYRQGVEEYGRRYDAQVRPLEQGPIGQLARQTTQLPSLTQQQAALGMGGQKEEMPPEMTGATIRRLSQTNPAAARDWLRTMLEAEWQARGKVGAEGISSLAQLGNFSDYFLHSPASTRIRAGIEALPGGTQLYAGVREFVRTVDAMTRAPEPVPEAITSPTSSLRAREGMSVGIPGLPFYVSMFRRQRNWAAALPTEAGNRDFANMLTDPAYQGRLARLTVVPASRRASVVKGIIADWVTSHPPQDQEQQQ